VSLLNPVFRVGRRIQTLTPAQRRRRVVPVGTAFRFRLNTAATVRIQLQLRTPGRRVGGRCVAVRRANLTRPTCVRFVTRMTLVRRNLRAGSRSVAFTGRIGARRLAPGRYRAVIAASGAGGTAVPVIRLFRVVR